MNIERSTKAAMREYNISRVSAATHYERVLNFGRRLAAMHKHLRSPDWDFDIDQQFEAQATWYVLRSGIALRAFVRVVRDTPAKRGPTLRLGSPVCAGPTSLDSLLPAGGLDINNAYYLRGSNDEFKLLMAHVFSDMQPQDAPSICVVAEDDNHAMMLNCGDLGFEDTNLRTRFETYRDHLGQPIVFRLLKQDANKRSAVAQHLMEENRRAHIRAALAGT